VSHAIPGRQPVGEALRAGRALREVVLEDRPELDDLAAAAGTAGQRVRRAPRRVLDDLAEGVLHQGAVAVADGPPHIGMDQLGETDLVVVLDGVTDPHNLGAIARTAEAAGAGAVVVPRRRSASVTPAAEKAAAGAFSWLPVVVVPNVTRALGQLAERGLWSVGLASEASATLHDSNLLDGGVALVVGAEGPGLSRLVRERVDGLVAIPLLGSIASLNVSAAAAVALFEVVRRRTPHP
jgi:23S rRNA (guanosine2251-2'-O)-methyltransferase